MRNCIVTSPAEPCSVRQNWTSTTIYETGWWAYAPNKCLVIVIHIHCTHYLLIIRGGKLYLSYLQTIQRTKLLKLAGDCNQGAVAMSKVPFYLLSETGIESISHTSCVIGFFFRNCHLYLFQMGNCSKCHNFILQSANFCHRCGSKTDNTSGSF